MYIYMYIYIYTYNIYTDIYIYIYMYIHGTCYMFATNKNLTSIMAPVAPVLSVSR